MKVNKTAPNVSGQLLCAIIKAPNAAPISFNKKLNILFKHVNLL